MLLLLCEDIAAMMVTTMKIRTYSELIQLQTFKERYLYLQLDGHVGESTFGFDRWLNQAFYKSDDWKSVRRQIILRDNACDLAIEGREIQRYLIIHHMNPITVSDIVECSDWLLNPEFLIVCARSTHNAIHYGDESLLVLDPVIRSKYDTCPWR